MQPVNPPGYYQSHNRLRVQRAIGSAQAGVRGQRHPPARAPPVPDTPSLGTPSLGHSPSQSPPVPGTAFPGHPLSGASPSPGIHHPGTPCPGIPTLGTPGPCQVTLLPRHHGRDTAPALEAPEQPHDAPSASQDRQFPRGSQHRKFWRTPLPALPGVTDSPHALPEESQLALLAAGLGFRVPPDSMSRQTSPTRMRKRSGRSRAGGFGHRG